MVTFSLNTAEAAPSGSINQVAEAEQLIGFISKRDAATAAAPEHLVSYMFVDQRLPTSGFSANELTAVWTIHLVETPVDPAFQIFTKVKKVS